MEWALGVMELGLECVGCLCHCSPHFTDTDAGGAKPK